MTNIVHQEINRRQINHQKIRHHLSQGFSTWLIITLWTTLVYGILFCAASICFNSGLMLTTAEKYHQSATVQEHRMSSAVNPDLTVRTINIPNPTQQPPITKAARRRPDGSRLSGKRG